MDLANFLLFFVGVCLLLGAFVVGIGAFEYEVVSLGTVDSVPEQQGFAGTEVHVVRFEELSERDRRIVERAIAGERFVFRDPAELPGERNRKGKFGVRRDGELYLVNRHLFFNWRTTFAPGAVALAIAGLGVAGEAVRREHFPDRTLSDLR